MKFQIKFTQEGGRRWYPVANFEVGEEGCLANDALAGFLSTLIRPATGALRRMVGMSHFLSYIKEGSSGLEIGVDRGDGLVRYLTKNPALVVGVDPYITIPGDDWSGDDQHDMDVRYYDAKSRVASHPEVQIVRMTSDEAFKEAGSAWDNNFDWVFIDGCHEHEACHRDLVNALRVTRPGGAIGIDDVYSLKWHDKIKPAIERFMSEHHGSAEVVYTDNDPVIIKVKDE